ASDGLVDYYDADVRTAQDYYPFGMIMPGRVGFQSSTGWNTETGDIAPENGLSSDVAIDSRTANQPPEYTATNSVELQPGFESGSSDNFTAFISEASAGDGDAGSASLADGDYRY